MSRAPINPNDYPTNLGPNKEANNIRNGRLSRFLSRLFDVQQGELGDVNTSLQPVVAAMEETSPEAYLARNEYIASGAEFSGVLAANYSSIWLVNPTGSNMLVMPRQVTAATSNAAAVLLYTLITDAAPPAIITETHRVFTDTREVGTGRPTPYVVGQVNPVFTPYGKGGLINLFYLAPNLPTIYQAPAVLQPGFSLVVIADPVNVNISAAFNWVQRAILNSNELTP